MKVQYIDRDGNATSKEDWQRKRNDATYTVLQEYDNGVVRAKLQWVGRVDANTFPSMWKNFVLLVSNYKADGTLVADPVDNDTYYANEAAATKGYQDFLAKWTACEIDEEGEFTEADNALVPPPPPSPDAPMSQAEELGETGAW